ncbi:TrkH family potassium uptake protein [Paenibacillus crassostreae]|uniref:ATP synthase subunit J n=1 Tax=Paenibacillus crassostreae TaxID=1763538 RepID=A0A167FIB3_9BACL|nr:TrkH family potassium uptake protein [Paenibacillus crassostreae]AOZ94377.1 Trk family potassium uptake protein [Paenibacillus crassostreae]OAB76586.1 ATP synthase subunit J [Paenibacillus crassostreae]
MQTIQNKKILRYLLTPPKILVIGFALIIFIGAILLSLPIASSTGEALSFIDALFMSTSATCVTGLAVIDPGTELSLFGEIVILSLFQIGGLGFTTMATLIALVFNKRISIKERLVLQQAMNHGSMEGIVRLMRKVIVYSLTIEFVGAVLLAIRFSVDMPVMKAMYYGLFHSISSFTNVGLDILGTIHGPYSSFNPYVNDPFVSIVIILLIFLGGIGFIVISDLLGFRKSRKLSLHSKVVLSVSLVLVVVGTIVIYIFEFTNVHTLQSLNQLDRIVASTMQSVTARSGGITTLDVPMLRQSTQFFMIILMFIGAAPGSTGGGIKVTTFAVLIGAVIAMARGKDDVVFFRNRISKDVVYKAITLTLLSFLLIIAFTMILSVTEDRQFLTLLFEVTSAFGTCGLSMGLTPELSSIGRVTITFLMFLGRLGPLTLAYALTPKPQKESFRYPEGKITIG